MTQVYCDRTDCHHCRLANLSDDVGECTLQKITVYAEEGCDEYNTEYAEETVD